jgi:hypothetical protein
VNRPFYHVFNLLPEVLDEFLFLGREVRARANAHE